MATDEDHQRAEASFQRAVATRNSKIAELRERSGLSMDELAKAMRWAFGRSWPGGSDLP
jgi:DNA-binding transcriptional regulator YiaG